MTQKILVMEDNKAHMEALCKILKELGKDICIYAADEVQKACQIALEQHIHLFLIDIIMDSQKPGDVSGLNFAKEIRGFSKYKFTPLVFITSLEDPQLYSYKYLHCFDYIEKPFTVSRVKETVLNALEFPIKEEENRYIYFRKDGIVYAKRIKDIMYIEIRRRKITIHCVEDDLEIPYKTCEEVLRELDSDLFIQCSRYTIVNRDYIEHIDFTNRYIKLKHRKDAIEIGAVMIKKLKQKIG